LEGVALGWRQIVLEVGEVFWSQERGHLDRGDWDELGSVPWTEEVLVEIDCSEVLGTVLVGFETELQEVEAVYQPKVGETVFGLLVIELQEEMAV
jgi:hypothetical protein